MEFKRNKAGIAAILKRAETAAAINAIADKVAANAGEDADVDHYRTDRAAASVAVPAHQQAIDGALTKACAKSGVPFRAK